jgi:hypothetical protein
LGVGQPRVLVDFRGREPFGAISGSPVYAASGELIGPIVSRYSFGSDGLVGVLPRERFESHWALAMKFRPSGAIPIEEPLQGSEPILPGQSVVALRIWGDYCAGEFGTVVDVRGSDVALLGHPWKGCGPCVYALARAPVRAVIHDMGRERVSDVGPVIGLVYFDGKGGLFGVLGARPPSVDLEIQVLTADGSNTSTRRYQIADDGLSTAEGLREALIDGYRHAAMVGSSTRWRASVGIAGGPVEVVAVDREESESAVSMVAKECLRILNGAPRAALLRVTLDAEQVRE